MKISLLLTPLAKAAYFDAAKDVALLELRALGFEDCALREVGSLSFIDLDAEEEQIAALMRASVCQGLFERVEQGLLPLDQEPNFKLPEALVTGQKYQGKTNELVTQLAINVALAHVKTTSSRLTLLDPMAGRGTTLLWALRYGMNGRGIDLDGKNIDLFHAHVKKQCKLHRLKHKNERGRIGKGKGGGSFARFEFDNTKISLVHGDSGKTVWQENQKFDLIVSDLPYGIQHAGSEKRSPFIGVEESAAGWIDGLRPGGAVTLIFNEYQTSRDDLSNLFEGLGLETMNFSASHRMSESIVRDVLVFTMPL